jgi:hypothetical protein
MLGSARVASILAPPVDDDATDVPANRQTLQTGSLTALNARP